MIQVVLIVINQGIVGLCRCSNYVLMLTNFEVCGHEEKITVEIFSSVCSIDKVWLLVHQVLLDDLLPMLLGVIFIEDGGVASVVRPIIILKLICGVLLLI